MIDGIYHVQFSSPQTNMLGDGLVVLKDSYVNGGDDGFIYLGSFGISGGVVSGKLFIKRWNPTTVSIFGDREEFELELSGSQKTDRSFQFSGNVIGESNLKINASGLFLSELAQ